MKRGYTVFYAKGKKSMTINLLTLSFCKQKSQTELLEDVNNHEQTSLHVACARGFIALVTLLLELGASSAAVDAEDKTPLHLAAE